MQHMDDNKENYQIFRAVWCRITLIHKQFLQMTDCLGFSFVSFCIFFTNNGQFSCATVSLFYVPLQMTPPKDLSLK